MMIECPVGWMLWFGWLSVLV